MTLLPGAALRGKGPPDPYDPDANMTKVFIAGSRQLSRLNSDVKRRIDTMVEKDFTILIGDANGADKAVQRYLIVHCMAENCRNNVADWPTREAVAPNGALSTWSTC